jgi:hypothetical protein
MGKWKGKERWNLERDMERDMDREFGVSSRGRL